jgi:hypothetical protein
MIRPHTRMKEKYCKHLIPVDDLYHVSQASY